MLVKQILMPSMQIFCAIIVARLSYDIDPLNLIHNCFHLPYVRHYKPPLVYFLPHFSVRFKDKSGFSITDNICPKQGSEGLKSAVSNQEGFQIKSWL